MTLSLFTILSLMIAYVGLMFFVAHATNKEWIPNSIINHPATYILSMGVFNSAWSYYGSVELAETFGLGALGFYIGAAILFLFAPVTLAPLAELTRRFKIPSLADLLVFRYHSQPVGILVTFLSLLALLPLLAVQIQVIADTTAIVTSSNDINNGNNNSLTKDVIAFVYCLGIAVFTLTFGASRLKHKGLFVTLAAESLIKLAAMITVGLLTIFGVFGGFSEIDTWLIAHPEAFNALHNAHPNQSAYALLVVFLTATLAMPHIFQTSMVNMPIARSMRITSWAFPGYLFVMAFPIFPILWAGKSLGVELPTEYFTLAVPLALEKDWITAFIYLGGISAATGALVSVTVACTVMTLNHIVLPFSTLSNQLDLRLKLIRLRKVIICVIFATAYLFFLSLRGRQGITDLALIAFIQVLQFFPAVFATPYWARANRVGLMVGVVLGSIIGLLGLLLPTLLEFKVYTLPVIGSVSVGIEVWDKVAFISLFVNCCGFVIGSLLTQQSAEERFSASLCTEDELSHPVRVILDVHSCEEIRDRLSQRLGPTMAEAHINKALEELGINFSERRPYSLRRLRDRLESNLSAVMGRSTAKSVVDKSLPFRLPEKDGSTDINLIESRLHRYRDRLTGLSAELDNLRRYHRNTLQELPLAVCSLGADLEVLMWNRAMEEITGIEASGVTGSHLKDLPEPWGDLLYDFCQSDLRHQHNLVIKLKNAKHFFNLHKADLSSPSIYDGVDGQVILVEDVTELKKLEQKLTHSERLASVGRLAAGVAHEIGNPVTGIACLAQNLKYEDENPETLETADQILSQTDRISRIVQSLVSFSRAGDLEGSGFYPIPLHKCAEEAIHLLSLQKDHTEVVYTNKINPELIINGDEQKLIQVFINLLSNARDASHPLDEIEVEAAQIERFIEIWVTDRGEGIKKEDQEKVLEPFFTTKDPGKGTGLGLAMVYSIVQEHGGSIEIESPVYESTQSGTRFIIRIPNRVESIAQAPQT